MAPPHEVAAPPALTDRQRASQLRKRLHRSAHAGDTAQINAALEALYDEADGPVARQGGGVNHPEAFAPMLEAAAIAAALGHEEYADEMWDNVSHLWRGYGLVQRDFDAATELMDACAAAASLEAADEEAADVLRGTALEGRVRLRRHAGAR